MPKNKTYAFGEKTDQQKQYEEEHSLLLNKWKKDFDDNKITVGIITSKSKFGVKKNIDKKNRKIIQDNNNILIVETCLKCNIEKPITPLYYHNEYNNSGISNINKISGNEQFCNSPTYGCRDCSKLVSKSKSQTQDEYIRILLKPYKKLTKEWYNSVPNICSISNLPLNEKNNVEWRVSIQNNGLIKDHLPKNCIKIAYEFNVQEQNAIINLKECWKEVFQEFVNEIINPSDTTELLNIFIQNYNNSPSENGVNVDYKILANGVKKVNPEYTKQSSLLHLKKILGNKLFNYKNADKVSKREQNNNYITVEQMYNKLLDQKCKCFYTGIPFSLNRDNWRHFSLERIDNEKNHTNDNTIFICRIFNTAGQLNRLKILNALTSQQLIIISEDEKIKIEEELLKI
jgi:hypothetical protein